ncbi:MAG TPA: aldo/keto reductase [Thermomicrobiales bacterium]
MINRGIERDLLAETERAGTGVIAFSPLASGVLSDKYPGDTTPDDSRAALAWDEAGIARRLSPERRTTLRALNDLAQGRGQTLSQLALAWVLRSSAVTSALIGHRVCRKSRRICGSLTTVFSAPMNWRRSTA